MPFCEKSRWLKGNTSSNGGFSFRGVYVLYAVLGSFSKPRFLVSFRFSQIQCWDSSWFGFADSIDNQKFFAGFFRQKHKKMFCWRFPHQRKSKKSADEVSLAPDPCRARYGLLVSGVNWKNMGETRPWEEGYPNIFPRKIQHFRVVWKPRKMWISWTAMFAYRWGRSLVR